MTGGETLAFLLVLVPWLIDRGRTSVAETAAHFGVTQEFVRECVELISISGVPGDTSAYQPDDLFDIAWDAFEEHDEIELTNLVAIDDAPRFSGREAAALIAGLQYLSALPDHADRVAIARLTEKLSRGASAAPSQVAVQAATTDETRSAVRRAIDDGRQLELDYADSQGNRERRTVDPVRLDSVDDDWYLRGWCHLRQAQRTFRLDRIASISVTEQPIEQHKDAVSDQLFAGSPDDTLVELEVAEAALPLVVDYLPLGAKPQIRGGLARIELRIQHLGSLARLVAGMPGVARVLGPPAARRAVAEWAKAGLAVYRD